MYLPHNQSTVRLYCMSILLTIVFSTPVFSQFNNSQPCYAIGKNSELQNVFYQYNNTSQSWEEKSTNSNSTINALTSNPVDKTIYATSNQNFGTINPVSGDFNPISIFSKTLNGTLGELAIDKIEALSYDLNSQVVFGLHRLVNQPDVLLKIDPSTGEIIMNSFTTSSLDGLSVSTDYQAIESLELNGNTYDIATDIAINPLSGQLFVMYAHDNNFCLVVSEKSDANIVAPLVEIEDLLISNLAFSSEGLLYAIAKDKTTNEEHVYQIDHFGGSINSISRLSDDTTIQFTAIECQKPYNDIALKIDLSPTQQLPVSQGDDVSFDIEIINQGEIEVNYVQIVNYLSSGLSLKTQDGWTFGNNFTLLDINEKILPDESIKKQIHFTVNEAFKGTLSNFAEINLYVNTYTDSGLPLVWSDIDSTPDNKNNEVIYIDNIIDQKGASKNQDEDDHDIVTLNVNTSCMAQLVLQNTIVTPGVYEVGDHIYTDNATVSNTTTFKAGRAIIMNNGFEVNSNSDFEVQISLCD